MFQKARLGASKLLKPFGARLSSTNTRQVIEDLLAAAKPGEEEVLIVNTDAAPFSGNNRKGMNPWVLSGVSRVPNDLAHRTDVLGFKNCKGSTQAEVEAILQFCTTFEGDKRATSLAFLTDSSEAAKWLNADNYEKCKFPELVRDTRAAMAQFKSAQVFFVGRKENNSAHDLCRVGQTVYNSMFRAVVQTRTSSNTFLDDLARVGGGDLTKEGIEALVKGEVDLAAVGDHLSTEDLDALRDGNTALEAFRHTINSEFEEESERKARIGAPGKKQQH